MSGTSKKKPDDPFYIKLGRAMRLARVAAGKSQADVAEHIDVSGTQLQKYETGVNRIPVRELVQVADFLDVPITALVESSGADAEYHTLSEKLSTKGFHTMLESWAAIKDTKMRAAIQQLIAAAAGLRG
jgi:transcriptional regulator with XRE-family HTH domain